MSDPIEPEQDDMFIYATSFLEAERLRESGRLDEGKSVGTAHRDDKQFLRDANTIILPAASLSYKRRVGSTVGKRVLDRVKAETLKYLLDAVSKHTAGKMTDRELEDGVTNRMKQSWREVFMAGVRATGYPGSSGDELVRLREPLDTKLLMGAIQHEMRFLNGFLRDIMSGSGKMPYDQRSRMYVDSLEAFYNNARVVGIPPYTLIYWLGPNDKRTCAGCRYLFKNSPYTKDQLPTVPKAGLTPCLCLTNCNANITTARGNVPWTDVKVGDLVWTHRGRWRRVMAKHHNRSVASHRYAVVVTPNGLMGVTDDHLLYTSAGFVPAREAAASGLRVLSATDHPEEQKRALSAVRRQEAVARGLGAEETRCGSCGARFAENALGGFDRGVVQHDQEGRATVRSLLGGQPAEVRVPLPLALDQEVRTDSSRLRPASCRRGLHERRSVEYGSEGVSQTQQGPRGGATPTVGCVADVSGRRGAVQDNSGSNRGGQGHLLQPPLRQQGYVEGACRVGVSALQEPVSCQGFGGQQEQGEGLRGRVLFSEVLRRSTGQGVSDPAVRLLQKEIQEGDLRVGEATVEVGQVLLLSEVLAVGTSLYDLEVQDDHSFTADGLLIHNSNCRDRLLLRHVDGVTWGKVQYAPGVKSAEQHVRALRKIKREA